MMKTEALISYIIPKLKVHITKVYPRSSARRREEKNLTSYAYSQRR